MPSEIRPGSYTLRWMIDVPRVRSTGLRPLRAAQIAAYALQPRYGTLAGSAVQPTDAEFIVNAFADDNISGVIRLQTTAPQTREAIGEAIVAAFRANGVPQAAPHLTMAEESSAATIANPIVGSFLAVPALLASVAGAREAVRARFGTTVIDVRPGIANDRRPAVGATISGAASALTSRRVSEDPARDGSVGAQDVREAVNRASELFSVPSWLLIALTAAGVGAAGVLLYGVYRRVSGR